MHTCAISRCDLDFPSPELTRYGGGGGAQGSGRICTALLHAEERTLTWKVHIMYGAHHWKCGTSFFEVGRVLFRKILVLFFKLG